MDDIEKFKPFKIISFHFGISYLRNKMYQVQFKIKRKAPYLAGNLKQLDNL